MHPSTTARSCSGASVMPGRIGAIRTPHGIPAWFSAATASRRFRGCGVPGSLAFHASSSSVPIENAVETSATCAASTSRSRSRRISVPFVRMEKGFR
jgi:hypothetical protein